MVACIRYAASTAAVAVVLLLALPQACAEPQNGWWWNPNESGRGYFIEMTGGVMYLAGYFYDVDGRATWLSSGGRITDPYAYSGTLQAYRGGQSAFGTYRLPAPAVDVGAVSVNFSDDSHGTITWPGGTVQIERQIFGTVDPSQVLDPLDPMQPAFRPKTGWWWNPAESGSGYSVEVQGDNAFVVAFMYDEQGEPIWYFTAGPMSSPTHFESDWLEFSAGQTLTGPYRAPGTPRNLGRVTIDFASYDDATITFTESSLTKAQVLRAGPDKSLPKAGQRSRKTRAAPQVPAATWSNPLYLFPYFACKIEQTFTVFDVQEGGTFTSTNTTTFDVVFKQITGSFRYTLDAGHSSYSYSYEDHDTHNDCRGHANKSGITPLYGHLDVSPHLYYSGRVYDLIGTAVTLTTDSCSNVQSQPPPVIRHVDVNVPLGNGFSMIQSPNLFPDAPFPYMKVTETHAEDDGSNSKLTWNCVARPYL